VSTKYRFGGAILVTVIIAWVASKTGTRGLEMTAILALSGLGLSMLAGIDIRKKWTDDN
jgi:hypothetical protein